MSKYKVFDRFVIEIAEVIEDVTTTLYRVKGFNSLVFDKYGLDKLKKIDANFKINDIDDMLAEYDIRKDGYNKGLQDAWKLAKKISNLPQRMIYDIFKIEDAYLLDVFEDNTYQEALAKIEAYDKEQEKIKVGDVVEHKDEIKSVVMDVLEEQIAVFTENGCIELWINQGNVKKTGKHIDIGSLLKKIGGE